MSFFEFGPSDIIHTSIITRPRFTVSLVGNRITGSVTLDKPYLSDQLLNRQTRGFSEVLGGLTTRFANITASVDFASTSQNGANKSLYASMQNLYAYHSLANANYSLANTTSLRIINVPQIYYDRTIASGTFTAADTDSQNNPRKLFDDGTGIVRVGSLTGSAIGHIFYGEGLVALTASTMSDFASANPSWQVCFAGSHTIPVVLYRCRAPAGQLNATTNPTFFYTPTTGTDRGTRQVLTSSLSPYVTAIGLYNDDYELIATARLAQPVKKEFAWDISFNIKIDW